MVCVMHMPNMRVLHLYGIGLKCTVTMAIQGNSLKYSPACQFTELLSILSVYYNYFTHLSSLLLLLLSGLSEESFTSLFIVLAEWE